MTDDPDKPAPKFVELSGTARPTKAMREWMEKMKQEATRPDPVDHAQVTDGWWIVHSPITEETECVEVVNGDVLRAGHDEYRDVVTFAEDYWQFLRKLDLEKMIGDAP